MDPSAQEEEEEASGEHVEEEQNPLVRPVVPQADGMKQRLVN